MTFCLASVESSAGARKLMMCNIYIITMCNIIKFSLHCTYLYSSSKAAW